jgi:2-polyprenyl-3-methyl-5-hydroxy-6-metoxy-1,4-benzoquinol methylase
MTDEVHSAILAGHTSKTLFDWKSGIISWSHRRRFAFGLKLVRDANPSSLLDYGCGDGAFLAMLAQDGGVNAACVGAELTNEMVNECRSRFAMLPDLRFRMTEEVESVYGREAFEMAVCMEVLEHAARPELVLDRLHTVLKQGGRLIVSVPVETGIPLMVKQAARLFAARMGVRAYVTNKGYSLSELRRSVFAGESQHIPRIPYREWHGQLSFDHKGFNWKVVRGLIAERFSIEGVHATPVPALGPDLGSQAWMIARKD